MGVGTLGLAGDDALGLVEGNAERLGTHARSAGILGNARVLLVLAGTQVLDLVLTLLGQAVGDQADVLVVQGGGEVIPVGDDLAVGAVLGVGAVVQVLLDSFQESGHGGGQLGDLDGSLAVLSGDVTTSSGDEAAGKLARTELETQRDTAEFPLVELPAGGVTFSQIALGADAGVAEGGNEALNLAVELLALLIGGLGGDTDGDDDGLGVSDTRREDETAVVTVDHDHDTEGTGGQTPGVLPHVERSGLLLVVALGGGVLDGDTEHLTEVLAQTVGGTTLDTTTGGGDVALNGGGVETTGELLLLGLLTLDNRNSQKFLVDTSIEVEDCHNLLVSTLLGQVGCVTLLPQELSGSEERLGVLELPTDDGVPLVELEGQVTVTSDPLGVVGVHDSLRRGTDSDLLLQRGGTTVAERGLSVTCLYEGVSRDKETYACVTQATSAAKPSMWSFSLCSTSSDTKRGKEQFLTPIFLM